jgi:hypothetical protein
MARSGKPCAATGSAPAATLPQISQRTHVPPPEVRIVRVIAALPFTVANSREMRTP